MKPVAAQYLEGFGEFLGKRALGRIAVGALVLFAASTAALDACADAGTNGWSSPHTRSTSLRADELALGRLTFGFRRLSGIRTKEAVLERCSIETPDDGLHLLSVGGFNKSEAFGLLRLGITDYFDTIGNQVFCGEPRLDIVCGHPDRKISKKNGGTHSVGLFTS